MDFGLFLKVLVEIYFVLRGRREFVGWWEMGGGGRAAREMPTSQKRDVQRERWGWD